MASANPYKNTLLSAWYPDLLESLYVIKCTIYIGHGKTAFLRLA